MMMKHLVGTLLMLIALITAQLSAAEATDTTSESELSADSPPNAAPPVSEPSNAWPPLIERYVLDELKSIRMDMQSLRADTIEQITNRELEVAGHSMSYANTTVTYFFYLIASLASLGALVGWHSLRDLKQNTKTMAEQELKRLTERYETKLKAMEFDLRQKTRAIADNNKEIEKLNEIHSLWLRAGQEPSPQNQIAIYDEILRIRPGDLEATTHKADAALEMGERRWALSLCNRVLEMDPQNAHALYQRACCYAGLGQFDQSLSDLALAIRNSHALVEVAQEDNEFEVLRHDPRFEQLIHSDAEAAS